MKQKPLFIIAVMTIAVTLPVNTHAEDKPRLQIIEAACIEYAISGQMQTGTSIRCHRDYGYEQYEIQDINIGLGGFSQTTNQHVITIGKDVYSINLENNSGTKIQNPMYEQLIVALQDSSPEQMAQSFLNAMGYQAAGTTKTVANTSCNVYSSPQLGSACFTDDLLMLEQSVPGNIMTMTAVSVNIGTSGDDTNYTLYQSADITEGPDLSNFNLQDLINQGGS